MAKHKSPEQIVKILRQAEAFLAEGIKVPAMCRELSISQQTYYRWKKKYGNMNKSEVKRLKELETENARLKQLLAEAVLDKAIIEEVLKGKF